VTSGAFQTTFQGGDLDGYVTKLNPAGTRAVYSTYLGGSDFDIAGSVRVDRRGVAHVPGVTGSTDFPVTRGAFQPTDAFLVLLSRNGSHLQFGSYLGGSGEDGSVGAGSWLDGKGNYFIPGFTNSSNFPVTPGAFQTENAGAFDVFLVKVDLEKPHKDSGPRPASITAQQPGSSGPRAGLSRDRVARLRRATLRRGPTGRRTGDQSLRSRWSPAHEALRDRLVQGRSLVRPACSPSAALPRSTPVTASGR
jgi:hypothetical protein